MTGPLQRGRTGDEADLRGQLHFPSSRRAHRLDEAAGISWNKDTHTAHPK